MKECNNCKYRDCWEYAEPCDSCTNLMGKMGKPMYWEPQTNYDRLVFMTPEEMAKFITDVDLCELLCGSPPVCDGYFCEQKMLSWLKSPVEVDNG